MGLPLGSPKLSLRLSPGLFWALLGSLGLSSVLLGSPGLSSLGLSWALLGSPGLSWAFMGSPGLPLAPFRPPEPPFFLICACFADRFFRNDFFQLNLGLARRAKNQEDLIPSLNRLKVL